MILEISSDRFPTDQVVTLVICIPDALGSNLGEGTNYLEYTFCISRKPLQANAGTVPEITSRGLQAPLPHTFSLG
jgi:hypothetical protein